jgi:hypothetical protein
MLAAAGLISTTENEQLQQGLAELAGQLEAGRSSLRGILRMQP